MSSSSKNEKVQHESKKEFSVYLKEKAEEILEISVDRALDDLVDNAMAEKDEEVGEAVVNLKENNMAGHLS